MQHKQGSLGHGERIRIDASAASNRRLVCVDLGARRMGLQVACSPLGVAGGTPGASLNPETFLETSCCTTGIAPARCCSLQIEKPSVSLLEYMTTKSPQCSQAHARRCSGCPPSAFARRMSKLAALKSKAELLRHDMFATTRSSARLSWGNGQLSISNRQVSPTHTVQSERAR